MAQRGATPRRVGNTPGGRGPLPGRIMTQADYYRSGRTSPSAPGATVRDAGGAKLSGKGDSHANRRGGTMGR